MKKGWTMGRFLGIVCVVSGFFLLIFSFRNSIAQNAEKNTARKEFEKRKQLYQVEKRVKPHSDGGKEILQEQENVKENEMYLLRIPKIEVEEFLQEGMDASVLADSLGHMEGSAYPGEIGNCVIAGHRNYTFGKFFNRLNEIKPGDEIYIDTLSETYTYKVSEVKIVEPEQIEILKDCAQEKLTLFTCTPIYVATHRLVVTAFREDGEGKD